jgi:RecA/RadA recombinase
MSKMGSFLKSTGLGTATAAVTLHLDTGYPPLNKIVSGSYDLGLPAGQITMIAGPSASGKTMIATQLMISSQKHGGFAAFFDHEYAYAVELAEKQGLQTDDPDKYLYIAGVSFEQSMKQSIDLANFIRDNDVVDKDAPIVFIFDSLAGMIPAKKLEKDVDALTMNDSTMLARSTSQLFPVIAQVFKKLNVTAVFINQVRDTLQSTRGPGGTSIPVTVLPGGKSPYYYASTILVLSGSNLYSSDKTTLIGKTINCRTEKSRATRPGKKVSWNFMFDPTGGGKMDAVGSYADYLKETGVIKSAGSRVEWDGGKPYMSQVKQELYDDEVAGMEKLHNLRRAAEAEKKLTAAGGSPTATED